MEDWSKPKLPIFRKEKRVKPKFNAFAKAKADGLVACPICESRGKPMFFTNNMT
ncbi:MAG: hypothetical protein QMD20_01900 [Candidatus Bathyarchaeia archaeon]|nr:hypothetical protein [Candidatus Bathyarchaeia archaeon]